MTDELKVTKRDKLGSAATQRLRRSGHVPAVLYGHNEPNEHLAIPEAEVRAVLRHHSKMVKLAGEVSQTALISDMQWDPLGIEVLHLDLTRVNLKESVEVTVPIQVHGEAPGVRDGGVMLENLHEVDVRCPAGSIPEQLEVDVNDLQLGGQLIAGDLQLPGGVELLTPAETVIVHVEEPRQPAADEVEEATEGEPEVIAREDENKEQEQG